MRKNKMTMAAVSGLALLLVLALSLTLVRVAFAGVHLVPSAGNGGGGESFFRRADLALWGQEEMDPYELYQRACAATVYISWERKDEATGSVSHIAGSGMVISGDGYILTNAHCVAEAYSLGLPVTVELDNGSTYPAVIVGCDSETEVALLKIEARGLVSVSVDVSSRLRPCDKVYAMGHPDSDLKFTITSGILSDTDRYVTFSGGIRLHMLQFDAPVSPGNSGGPLFNAAGSVIGMVTAKYSALDAEGVGFALPIGEALDVAAILKEHGYVTGRPLIGITVNNVHAGMLRSDSPDGVLIHDVEPGLAADRAGLQPKDVIIGINETVIASLDDLTEVKKQFHAFDTVVVRFWRMGEIMETKLTFDEVTPEHPTGTVPAPAAEQPADDEWSDGNAAEPGTEGAEAP